MQSGDKCGCRVRTIYMYTQNVTLIYFFLGDTCVIISCSGVALGKVGLLVLGSSSQMKKLMKRFGYSYFVNSFGSQSIPKAAM